MDRKRKASEEQSKEARGTSEEPEDQLRVVTPLSKKTLLSVKKQRFDDAEVQHDEEMAHDEASAEGADPYNSIELPEDQPKVVTPQDTIVCEETTI
jgi:hypothetical protein